MNSSDVKIGSRYFTRLRTRVAHVEVLRKAIPCGWIVKDLAFNYVKHIRTPDLLHNIDPRGSVLEIWSA